MNLYVSLRWIFWVVLISAIPQVVGAQDLSKDKKDVLPEHAVWRFGNWGERVGLNGYYRIAFSPNGRLMVARNALNHVQLFDVQKRTILFEFKSYEDRQKIANFDFSPDSRYFLTASEGYMEKITVWDTQSGKRHLELDTDGVAAFFNEFGEICVLTQEEVLTYRADTGKRVGSVAWGDSGDNPITYSPTSGNVMSQRKIRKLAYKTQVFDIHRKTTTILDSPTINARSGVISPDGNWLAAVFNRQKEAFLWDLRDPHQKDRQKLAAHEEAVQSVRFSHDSRFLVSTGWDGNAYIWDVFSRQKIGKLSGHTAHVNSCAFSPNDFLLATGASGQADNSIIFWDFKKLLFPEREALSELPKFEKLWSDLSSSDHRVALDAVAILVDNEEQFNQQICDKLEVAATGASGEQIVAWIEDLSSPYYSVRLKAEEKLHTYRMQAETILHETLARNDIVLEVKYRINRILDQPIERPEIPVKELAQLHRAIFTLELIGSNQTQVLLQNIAETHSHVDVARDAASSMQRVKMRQAQ